MKRGNMKTTVKLQEPFSYAIWPIIVIGAILAGYLIYLLIRKQMRSGKQKNAREKIVVKQHTSADIKLIKANYISELEKIKSDLCNNQLTTRDAYQQMSMCIRRFVYDVTGIKVQNYTLEDIRQLNITVLEELIMEYYIPEFATESIGNSIESIEKTKRAIEKWNSKINL